MKIMVIGHICFDVISLPNAIESKSYGGIFFSIAALANLLDYNDIIIPVFGINENDYKKLLSTLGKYDNIDTSGIFKFKEPTNRVHLIYSDDNTRIECSKHISKPIPWYDIKPLLNVEMVFINMISGYDITLETMDLIKTVAREQDIKIYLDVHCLPRGINSDYTRFYHPIDTWRNWLYNLHAVQMNEIEVENLTPEHLDEKTLAKYILESKTEAVHITKGEKGSTLYITQHRNLSHFDIPAFESKKVVDTTGCGDVFGAAYCASYMKKRNIIEATIFANQIASFNTQYMGSSEIDKLSVFRLN